MTDAELHRLDQLVACGLSPVLSVTVSAYHLPDGPVVVRIDEERHRLHGWLLHEAMRTHGHRSTSYTCSRCAEGPRVPRLSAADVLVALIGALGVVGMLLAASQLGVLP